MRRCGVQAEVSEEETGGVLTGFSTEIGRMEIIRYKFGPQRGEEMLREQGLSGKGDDPGGVYQSFTIAGASSADHGKSWIVRNLVTGQDSHLSGRGALGREWKRLSALQYTVSDANNARARKYRIR